MNTLIKKERVYFTVKQNWDGNLWPKLWPNKKFAWFSLEEETGKTKEEILATCDWSIVKIKIIEI